MPRVLTLSSAHRYLKNIHSVWRNLRNDLLTSTLILGGVGWISQVPQGGIPSEGPQFQGYIWDPVWSRAKTHAQEHFVGLGQVWGAAQNSEQVGTSVWALCPVFQPSSWCSRSNAVYFPSGLGSQMGRPVGAQLRCGAAEWLQIRLFCLQEHHDLVTVRFHFYSIVLQMWFTISTSTVTEDISVLGWGHQRPQIPMLIWGLIISSMQSCRMLVGFHSFSVTTEFYALSSSHVVL